MPITISFNTLFKDKLLCSNNKHFFTTKPIKNQRDVEYTYNTF